MVKFVRTCSKTYSGWGSCRPGWNILSFLLYAMSCFSIKQELAWVVNNSVFLFGKVKSRWSAKQPYFRANFLDDTQPETNPLGQNQERRWIGENAKNMDCLLIIRSKICAYWKFHLVRFWFVFDSCKTMYYYFIIFNEYLDRKTREKRDCFAVLYCNHQLRQLSHRHTILCLWGGMLF